MKNLYMYKLVAHDRTTKHTVTREGDVSGNSVFHAMMNVRGSSHGLDLLSLILYNVDAETGIIDRSEPAIYWTKASGVGYYEKAHIIEAKAGESTGGTAYQNPDWNTDLYSEYSREKRKSNEFDPTTLGDAVHFAKAVFSVVILKGKGVSA